MIDHGPAYVTADSKPKGTQALQRWRRSVPGTDGFRNWQLRATVNGRRRDIGLGSLALVSLKDAREAAFELRRDIQRGIDPVAERKRRRLEILTFKAAALRVHAEQKASWKNGKHKDQWITTLENYAFPLLGNRLVNDIEGPLIREVLLPIWLDKPETARRVKQRIGVVLDWAYQREPLTVMTTVPNYGLRGTSGQYLPCARCNV
jgi:Arm DNA-binding domain